ncbi:hypothetical protein PMIN04_000746 [Paraphaeosphaeria minitans]
MVDHPQDLPPSAPVEIQTDQNNPDIPNQTSDTENENFLWDNYTWMDYKHYVGIKGKKDEQEELKKVWYIEIEPYIQHDRDGKCKSVGRKTGFVFELPDNAKFRDKLENDKDVNKLNIEITKLHMKSHRDHVVCIRNNPEIFDEGREEIKLVGMIQGDDMWCTMQGKHKYIFNQLRCALTLSC